MLESEKIHFSKKFLKCPSFVTIQPVFQYKSKSPRTFVVYACGKSILGGGHMKKILLIDDSDTYTWCLQKYL